MRAHLLGIHTLQITMPKQAAKQGQRMRTLCWRDTNKNGLLLLVLDSNTLLGAETGIPSTQMHQAVNKCSSCVILVYQSY